MTYLGKWPRLLVAGDPVTADQADEILIRTADWGMMSGNDQEWAYVIALVTGMTLQDRMLTWQSIRQFEEHHGVLALHFLHNHRIASTWIDGPRGWCDWDGTVGCATWNIGKWPAVEEVHEDWTAIAEAFPFLTLSAQLVPDEGRPAEPSAAVLPAAEWRIHRGHAELNLHPRALLRPVEDFDIKKALHKIRYDPFSERGVSRERLQHAIATVRARREAEQSTTQDTLPSPTERRRIPVASLTIDPDIEEDCPSDTPIVRAIREHYEPATVGILAVSERPNGVLVLLDGYARRHAVQHHEGTDATVECDVYRHLTLEQEVQVRRSMNDDEPFGDDREDEEDYDID